MPSKRILIVDDDEVNVAILSTILEEYEYEIITAMNAAEAFKQLMSQSISLILLDRMMPGMSGLDFMRELRKNPKYETVPIIMQSAAATHEQVKEGLEAGVNEYLTKPFSENDLMSLIRKYLG